MVRWISRFFVPALACLAASLVFCACGKTSASGAGGGRGGRGGNGGGVPVVTAKVAQQDVPVDIAAVGNVEAYTLISIRSQVTGQIQQAFFHEGDVVKRGDPLFKI